MNSKKKSSGVVFTALFAALTAASCFIQIPLPTGLPIVIQDMMAMLSGLLLGPVYGTAAVFIFIILGSLGLPVFSGKAGIHVILSGPSGGFIIGYLLAALAGGLLLRIFLPSGRENSQKKQWLFISVAAVIATVIVFVLGIAGFMRVTGKDLASSVPLVLLPFVPGNTIKLFMMIFLAKKFRPVISNYLSK